MSKSTLGKNPFSIDAILTSSNSATTTSDKDRLEDQVTLKHETASTVREQQHKYEQQLLHMHRLWEGKSPANTLLYQQQSSLCDAATYAHLLCPSLSGLMREMSPHLAALSCHLPAVSSSPTDHHRDINSSRPDARHHPQMPAGGTQQHEDRQQPVTNTTHACDDSNDFSPYRDAISPSSFSNDNDLPDDFSDDYIDVDDVTTGYGDRGIKRRGDEEKIRRASDRSPHHHTGQLWLM